MSIFVCNFCKKEFSSNQNYKNHINKNICIMGDYECKYCNRKFTTRSSMYRHVNHICKVKQNEDNKRIEIFERLIILEEKSKQLEISNKEIDKLKRDNKQLKKVVDKLKKSAIIKKTINNTTTHINNGTINNIILVGYGKEDLKKINKDDLLKILQNGYNSTIKLTEAVHFNPKFPEYHNVYISNIKDKYAMMFDGKNWTLTIKEDLINKIYEDKKIYIEENLDDFLDSLATTRKRALERWLDTDDDDDRIKEIKEQIKLLLYNNRNIPMKLQNDNVHN